MMADFNYILATYTAFISLMPVVEGVQIRPTNLTVMLGGSVCLVCPVPSQRTGLLWILSPDTTLYRDNTNVGGHKMKSELNNKSCHVSNYSIQIKNITRSRGDGEYQCKEHRMVVATFRVTINYDSSLEIVWQGNVLTEHLLRRSGELECRGYGLISPVTLRWLVDGNEIKSKVFNESRGTAVNVTIRLYVANLKVLNKNITCIGSGHMQADLINTLPIIDQRLESTTTNSTQTGDNRSELRNILRDLLLLCAAFAMFVFSFSIFTLIRSHSRRHTERYESYFSILRGRMGTLEPSSTITRGPSITGPSSTIPRGPSTTITRGPSSTITSGPPRTGPPSTITRGPSSTITRGPSRTGPTSTITRGPPSTITRAPSSTITRGPSSTITSGPSIMGTMEPFRTGTRPVLNGTTMELRHYSPPRPLPIPPRVEERLGSEGDYVIMKRVVNIEQQKD
ncbi:uncharacterized protein [Apostichopus japonicus]|uniref:uncharacterized protein isoform X2 n=1 Tax=Stichopus japonicus TaxID=307972 RepID=UPI003AB63F1C